MEFKPQASPCHHLGHLSKPYFLLLDLPPWPFPAAHQQSVLMKFVVAATTQAGSDGGTGLFLTAATMLSTSQSARAAGEAWAGS